MQLIFTKGTGKHDTMDVVRAGVMIDRIDCPKRGIIPHDMVHYAVETTLQQRGFVHRILEGEQATFKMDDDAESDGVERLVEVFQADGWAGWNSAPTDMLDLYRVTCDARRCDMLQINAEDIEAVRRHILELSARWQCLTEGESMKLSVDCDGRAADGPAETAPQRA